MTRKLTDILLTLSDGSERLSALSPLSSANLNHQALASLSDLNTQELKQFQDAWRTFSATRRLELIERLIELAEEHVQYDYRPIFRWTLLDTDPAVRKRSIEALWEDERPRLIPVFQKLLQDDTDADVRATAAVALGQFVYWGELGTVDSPLVEDATQALWDCYLNESEDLLVRRRALEGIAASGRPGVARLIESANYSGEPEMRASALFAMGRNADPRWIPYLLPELEQGDPELRLEAVRALGELEARPAVRAIIQLIAVEVDAEIRMAALTALGQIGGPDARRALEAATEWEDDGPRVLGTGPRELGTAAIAEAALEELLSSDGSTFELINQVLGLDEDEESGQDWDHEYTDDLLDQELRDLLDDADEPGEER